MQFTHATDKPSAVIAVAAFKLRMAYGLDRIGWRGASVMKEESLVCLTAISRKRAAPLKQVAQGPKSSATLKTPLLTCTAEKVSMLPCCVPIPTSAVS